MTSVPYEDAEVDIIRNWKYSRANNYICWYSLMVECLFTCNPDRSQPTRTPVAAATVGGGDSNSRPLTWALLAYVSYWHTTVVFGKRNYSPNMGLKQIELTINDDILLNRVSRRQLTLLPAGTPAVLTMNNSKINCIQDWRKSLNTFKLYNACLN